MQVIIRGRQKGKTQALINLAHENFYYIVCRSQDECTRIFHLALKQGKDIPFPISYSEFFGKHYCGRGIKGFLLDDVDYALQQISSVPIIALSLTRGEE
jgi:hypothetical protein